MAQPARAQVSQPAQSYGSEAYNFDLFVAQPQPRPKPRVKVAPSTRRRAKAQTKRLVGVLLTVLVIAILGAAVVDTYARVGEVQQQISRKNAELKVQQATYFDLVFQLESNTNLSRVEERALELGLVKVDKSQVTYIRVLEENKIEVQPTMMAAIMEALGGEESGQQKETA